MAKRRRLFRKIMKFFDAHKEWPIVTSVLIGICFAIFAFQQLVSIRIWGEYMLIPQSAFSRPWTFVTSIFLHANLDHLMFNMLGLAFFGYYVETAVGRKSLVMVFFLAGFTGGLSLLPLVGIGALGASGAIMGVLGFLAATNPDYPVRTFFVPWYRPALYLAVLYGTFDFLYLFASTEPIAYSAHLAGLVTGGLLGIYWKRRAKKQQGPAI